MPNQPKRNEAKLRRLIRELIREELERIEEEGPEPAPAEDGSASAADEREPDPPGRKESPAPPWAVFGSPQPAPDQPLHRPDEQSAPSRGLEVPFEPEYDLEPPPFIPRNGGRE